MDCVLGTEVGVIPGVTGDVGETEELEELDVSDELEELDVVDVDSEVDTELGMGVKAKVTEFVVVVIAGVECGPTVETSVGVLPNCSWGEMICVLVACARPFP